MVQRIGKVKCMMSLVLTSVEFLRNPSTFTGNGTSISAHRAQVALAGCPIGGAFIICSLLTASTANKEKIQPQGHFSIYLAYMRK
jgi:hypothetical protein